VDNSSSIGAVVADIERNRPSKGANLVLVNDYAEPGNQLEVIGQYESSLDANDAKAMYEQSHPASKVLILLSKTDMASVE